MRTWVVLAALVVARPVAAEEAEPPRVLVLAESSKTGTLDLAVMTTSGERTAILAGLPSGTYAIAIHAATGRWAMTFHQLSNGDPLEIDGKVVSKPLDRSTLVVGDLDGVTATAYGDPACTSKKKACFETPERFSEDGAYVFVQSLASSWATWGRWTFGAKPKRSAVADKKLGELHVSPDLERCAYVAKDGVHVTAWPAQKRKAKKAKASKKPIAKPDLLMSLAWPIGDRVYWFRREPAEQKRGWFEAYDLTRKEVVTLHEATLDFPMMSGDFVSTGPRGTVLFLDAAAFDRHDVMEVAVDGATAARVASDIRQLLDVSPDGRYLLATRRKAPDQAETLDNPERLVIIDLTTKQDVAVLDVHGNRVSDAGFVSP